MTTVRLALAFLSLLFANSASAAREQHLCKEPAPVNALLASFGMNTHMQQGWQYEDAARTVSTLKELGITQVREAFTGLGHPGLEYAAREGIRFVFIVWPNSATDVIAALEAWEKRYPGSILAIEGPNEVNNWPVTYKGNTGIEAAQQFQHALYEGVRGSSVLKDIPVLALTSWPVFPNKSDIGNIHAYSRSGDFISPYIHGSIVDETTLNPPAKRIWMTEAGYHTHLGEDYDEGVSESVQAKMVLSLYLDAYAQNVEKTFLYQLANQYTDPNDEQAYFGLVDQQWKPKLSFKALKAMIDIIGQEAGSGAEPTRRPLSYLLDGMPSTGQQRLFQNESGDWLLVVWNEPIIWDKEANIEIENEKSTVVLRLQREHSKISLLDPLVGTSAVEVARQSDIFSFVLDDHPLAIRIQVDERGEAQKSCDQRLPIMPYARCVMQALEHGLGSDPAQGTYITACMRAAGFVPQSGGLTSAVE
ncbi:MAG: hypothetical protein E5Y58_00845 [Mesorhizobium sp.]|nr:MAG: hypothetical protein E5Y58_00845 [Mesorhizobium sp.]